MQTRIRLTTTSDPVHTVYKLLSFAFLVMLAQAVFSVLATIFAVALAPLIESVIPGYLAAGACTLLLAVSFVRYQEVVTNLAIAWLEAASRFLDQVGSFWIIAIGLGLRLGLLAAFFSDPISDAATYHDLAEKLAKGLPYEYGQTYSWWPPGLPLFLMPFVFLFGKTWLSVLTANVFLYLCTAGLLLSVMRQLMPKPTANLCLAIYSVWPSLALGFLLLSKELLLLAIVLCSLWLYLFAVRRAGRLKENSQYVWLIGASGVVWGLACLTQPSLLLAPGVIMLAEVIRTRRLAVGIVAGGMFAMGLIIAISPWTVRNYYVLNAFVPVSTTGGENFYSANNEIATGGWISEYPRKLTGDELEASRQGFQYGLEWIRSNPTDFLSLGFKKQVVLLGDNASSAYWALKRGYGVSNASYALVKLGSNLFWLLLVLLIFTLLAHRLRTGFGFQPVILHTVLFFIYVWLIDSVFQSGSRHLMPFYGHLLLTLGLLLTQANLPPSNHNAKRRE